MIRILSLALVLSTSTLPAQTAVRAKWDELAPLVKKRTVRVLQTGGKSVQGKIRSIDAGGLTVRIPNAEGGSDDVRIERDQIRTLSFQKGRSLGRKVGIIAAAAGAGALGFIGVLGVALHAKDAAIGGLTGAVGGVAVAVILATTEGDRWTEVVMEP